MLISQINLLWSNKKLSLAPPSFLLVAKILYFLYGLSVSYTDLLQLLYISNLILLFLILNLFLMAIIVYIILSIFDHVKSEDTI